MKAGWTRTRLGLVTSKIGSGATPLGGESAYQDSGISLIRSLNVYDDGFRDAKLAHISEAQAQRLSNVIVEKGDVLLNITGASIARCCVVPTHVLPARVNQHVSIIRPLSGHLDSKFLQYLLISRQVKEKLLQTGEDGGSTRQAITKSQLQEFRIDFPESLPEQQRIVGILDEAFEGIAKAKANTEKNLQNAQTVFLSHLQTVFTQRNTDWTEKRVADLARHSLGKMLDKAKNRGQMKPYLRNLNVRWFAFDLSDLLEMPFLPTETERYTAVKGDVLVCEGGYPGRAAIWDSEQPVYFQKALHRVRFHELELNKWFLYYLYWQDASAQLSQHFSGAGIQHFTGEVLARFIVPIPPVDYIQQSVKTIELMRAETQRLEAIYQRELAALEELKQSILHEAFSGNL